ncbi:very-long-chain enoyl-CoA reductase [Elysia marginata]|uniref:Very-long-chain enoyl-CoA reductase n=1 Tax=Elysia marginata TaxID=1093978 RepID=A0AAV4JZ68_9GAST|nr:very-long-chain enoyl-CoA reductase [Elysia marginata]
MSAAFDTIDRVTLLNILETIIEEDELRLVRFLLSNTCLNKRIGGAKEEKKFTSNTGTPQGDSLSPVLFVVYLENALKEVRPLPPQLVTESEKTLPDEIAYADDVDFIARKRIDVSQIQKVLKRYNLEVNVDKTEYTILDRKENSWKNTKKVGSLIGDTADVQRRKQLSTAALAKLQNVRVRGDKLKKKTKLKLYRALVKSVVTYNCST